MGDKTGIEWTDATWNPVTGCTKVSVGCKNCYAEKQALRLQKMGQANYANGFKVTCHPSMLDKPRAWKRPRRIFVNSMSDLFHEEVPEEFILDVFKVMQECPQHTFQVLTKRPERAQHMIPRLPVAGNIWLGTSVEDREAVGRCKHLFSLKGYFPVFLSIEPLLGPIDWLPLDWIDWVIVGGESGPGARPCRAEWVRSIRDQCAKKGVPFFFKQWGGVNKKSTGNLLDGKQHLEMPETMNLTQA